MSDELPTPHQSPMLDRLSLHVRHGFFGRTGGVSLGHYASLNCGMGQGDEVDNVTRNRALACRSIGVDAARLALSLQVHSADALLAVEPTSTQRPPQGDALVTNVPGLAVGVVTADCAPILLIDPHAGDHGVCAAVHAGWRGAVTGVIENAVAKMVELGADAGRVCAAVGPCLSQASFEVGPDLVDAVLDASPWAQERFADGEGDRSLFDYCGYLSGRLARIGVGRVEVLGEDTLSQPHQFFSHRYSQQSGAKACGRNLSIIALLP